MMSDSIRNILRPTAISIFEIARDLDMIDEMYEELMQCDRLFQDMEIVKFFLNNEVPKKLKVEFLRDKISPVFSNESARFICILSAHDTLFLLSEILSVYRTLVDSYRGRLRVDITSAYGISQEDVNSIVDIIRCFSGRDVYVVLNKNMNILSGVIIKVDSLIYDYSIKNQMHLFSKKIRMID